MPIKPLSHLCLLMPSHQAIPVFSQMFLLRLRFSSGRRALHLLRNEELGVWRFSIHKSYKSLIKDESQLRDWVNELRFD